MAYETGTATGVVDLVNKLATFIEANGWTRDSLGDEGSGRRYHAHRSSQYLNMRAYVNETVNSEINGAGSNRYGVAFNIGTGYNGATAWYKQAGTPQRVATTSWWTAGISAITGAIVSYHFFAHNSGDQIYAVVEYASGKYQWFGFGLFNKFGSFTGGDFMFGSNEGVNSALSGSTFGAPFGYVGQQSFAHLAGQVADASSVSLVTVDVDAESGWHEGFNTSNSISRRKVLNFNQSHYIAGNYWSQPNSVNAVSVFLPMKLYVSRSATTGGTGSGLNYAPIGEIPEFFLCSIESLTPAQQVTLGAEDYRVFPLAGKGASATDINTSTRLTGYYGFAVKE